MANNLSFYNNAHTFHTDLVVPTPTANTTVTLPSSGTVATEEKSLITLATAQATTSGTFKDFTIPSRVKRVTVIFYGVSTNGTSHLLVQLGGSGGVEATGYAAGSGFFNSVGQGQTDSVTGFVVWDGVASNSLIGIMQIDMATTYTYISSHKLHISPSCISGAGSKTLPAELTTVRITTVNGTDTFDAGTVNVSWEF